MELDSVYRPFSSDRELSIIIEKLIEIIGSLDVVQNIDRSWGAGTLGCCGHQRAEVRPNQPRDQQPLSLAWDVTKDVRTPDTGLQQWLLKSKVGLVCTHPRR